MLALVRNCAFAAGLCIGSSHALAAVLRVPEDYGNIQLAIDAAENGDEIVVGPGTWVHRLFLGWQQQITVRSTDGAAATTLRAAGNGSVISFQFGSDCLFEGFTIEGGNAMEGAAVFVNSVCNPIFRNCKFVNNTANATGGAIHLQGPSEPDTPLDPMLIAVFEDCVFRGNSASLGGAVYGFNAEARFTRCTLKDNTADLGGAAHFRITNTHAGPPVPVFPTFTDCVLLRNTADRGGAISTDRAGPILRDTTLRDNAATDGGAIFILDSRHTMMVEACLFETNTASRGGAIFAEDGNFEVRDSRFDDNTATSGGAIGDFSSRWVVSECVFARNAAEDRGGAIHALLDDGTIESCRFNRNTAASGGGVYIEGCFGCVWDVRDCTFRRNVATIDAGGLALDFVSTASSLIDCAFIENEAGACGGGLYLAEGGTPPTGCTFEGNTADDGAGLFCRELEVAVASSSFSGNRAETRGGGLYVAANSVISATGCLFAGNHAGGRGGGAFNANTGALSLMSCTVDGNTANRGAGLYNAGDGPLAVSGSELSGNAASITGGGVYSLTEQASLEETRLCANLPEHVFDTFDDRGGNTFSDTCPPPCPPDLNENGFVGMADLLILLANWGTDGSTTGADLDGDGIVGMGDLVLLLNNWGPCPD